MRQSLRRLIERMEAVEAEIENDEAASDMDEQAFVLIDTCLYGLQSLANQEAATVPDIFDQG